MPALELKNGDEIIVKLGSGEDTADTFHADGMLGVLGGIGAVGLYRGSGFGTKEDIVSFVSWSGGIARRDVARAAGIWGDDDVEAGEGDAIVYLGEGVGAEAYVVQAAATADVGSAY